MIPDDTILQIVNEKLSGDLRLQQKELIKESPRSLIYQYNFVNQNSETCSIILKYYQEQTQEAIVFAYFFTHSLFTDIIVHCGVVGDHTLILMLDISKSHQNISDWQPPVSAERRKNLIYQIANFHSKNWHNYPDLVRYVGFPWHLQSESNYRQHLDYLRQDFDEFRNNLPFPMTPKQLRKYDEALEDLHGNTRFLFEHLHENSIFTFIHGDLNACNVYYPREQGDEIILLDYEAFRVGLFGDDLVMLLIHDLYHGASITRQMLYEYYQCIQDDIKNYLTPVLYERSIRHSITEGLFFPMKLYAHSGVKDQELVMKSLDAYEQLVCSSCAGYIAYPSDSE
jgi:hypothetical protein